MGGEKREREFCHSSLFADSNDNLLAGGNSFFYDLEWSGHAGSERSSIVFAGRASLKRRRKPMNKLQNRITGTPFRLLFLNLLWLPIILALAFLVVRQYEAGKPLHRTGPNQILQFTSGGHILGFASGGVYVASGSHALHVEFVNPRVTNPVSDAAPGDGMPGNAQRVAPLSRVTYPNLWDGVTLIYDASSGAVVRSTYRLEARANAGNIRLRYNAPVAVQSDGSLRVRFQTGTLNETAPQAWQERDGKRVPVRIAFAPRGNGELTFAVGDYDRSEPLFIDPTLT
jgi:hypothetical protein